MDTPTPDPVQTPAPMTSPVIPVTPPPRHNHPLIWAGVGAVVVLALVFVANATGIWPSKTDVAVESPTPSMSASPDAMAGWKTYTNTQYGFEIRYPDSVPGYPRVKEYGGVYPYTGIRIQNYASSERVSLDEDDFYLEISVYQSTLCDRNEYSGQVALPGGEIGFVATGVQGGDAGGAGRITYCFRSPVPMTITVTEVDSKANLASQILSTFKFTTSPTAGWKTYTNAQYGFEVKYPETYRVRGEYPNPDPSIVFVLVIENIESSEKAKACSCGVVEGIDLSIAPNPTLLSVEDYLKRNYQNFLGTPSKYTDFAVNEAVNFNGYSARKIGTEREQFYLLGDSGYIYTLTTGNPQILSTFKFTK